VSVRADGALGARHPGAADLHGRQYLGRAYEALKDGYGVPDEHLEFFRVYLEDVASHLSWEEEALAY
jgi:hypothetical protein